MLSIVSDLPNCHGPYTLGDVCMIGCRISGRMGGTIGHRQPILPLILPPILALILMGLTLQLGNLATITG